MHWPAQRIPAGRDGNALSTLRRNNEIECLRAIAVLGVAFHHMLGNLFKNGLPALGAAPKYLDFWFGVDLFFAISGYVIARSLLPQLAASEGKLRQQMAMVGAFWIRRAWRLLPSAWLWLGLTLLAVAAFNRSSAFGTLHANLMATLAGLFDYANIRFAHAFFRYEYGASFVYWSLSLEEQFYFLLPLLVLCLRRRIDLFMIALVAVQFALIRTPLLMSLRTDAIALGVLLAMAAPTSIYASAAPRYLLGLGTLRWIVPGLLLALLAMLAAPIMMYWRLHVGMIAVISVVLVWIASYNRGYLFPEGRIERCLVWIGARSYAIYLIHVPVFFLIREVCYRLNVGISNTGLPAVVFAIVAAGLIALFAELNYRYVEQPLRRRGRRIADLFLSRRGYREPSQDSTQTASAPGGARGDESVA
jgi:peptidoglycan/LPS O-acetylase OafA/YrhL